MYITQAKFADIYKLGRGTAAVRVPPINKQWPIAAFYQLLTFCKKKNYTQQIPVASSTNWFCSLILRWDKNANHDYTVHVHVRY